LHFKVPESVCAHHPDAVPQNQYAPASLRQGSRAKQAFEMKCCAAKDNGGGMMIFPKYNLPWLLLIPNPILDSDRLASEMKKIAFDIA
jgi:hypothetical protein